MLLGLHGEHGEFRENARDEPRSRMHAKRLRRHLAVDERHGHAAAVRETDEVRPELRLRHDEQPRIEAAEIARDHERQVDGQRHDAVPRVQLARRREPRRRECRDHERSARMVALEPRDERPQHGDFAGRRPVQPDAGRQAVAEAHAEAQREVAPPRRAQAVHEPRREDRCRRRGKRSRAEIASATSRARLSTRRSLLQSRLTAGSYGCWTAACSGHSRSTAARRILAVAE